MAHFAKIENNIVTAVIVISNEDCGNLDFPLSEPLGQNAIKGYGIDGYWLQTSFNTNANQHPNNKGFRKNFAGIDYTYDPELDAFIAPKPYPSWILSLQDYQWHAPVAHPDPNILHYWDEENLCWVLPQSEDL